MTEIREHWGSKTGFILAAAGSAIGLGNIWKFPYIAGENGGGAFVMVYLICICLVGLPVLIAEILMGRTAQRNPVGAFFKISNGNKAWASVGAVGVVAGFVILSFYSVVAGWSLGYFIESLSGVFKTFSDASIASAHFAKLSGSPIWTIGMHGAFFLLTMSVVYFGVKDGIERGSKIMMPALFLIILVLVIRGITLPGARKGIEFLLNPDWTKINSKSVLVALGHAFFTLSLGMGAMMTYGSYLSKKENLPQAGLQIVFLDTLIAILAGLAIFTAVFATGQNPASGPGLIFQILPVVFAKMPGGTIFAVLFFLLLTVAALTSAISLLEVVVAYFVDEKNWPRRRAVIVFGIVTFLIGVPSALSFNLLSDVTLGGKTYFDIADHLASNYLLPLGGLVMAIFVAWVWGMDEAIAALKGKADDAIELRPWITILWRIFLKYFSPVLIFVVFLYSIGLIG